MASENGEMPGAPPMEVSRNLGDNYPQIIQISMGFSIIIPPNHLNFNGMFHHHSPKSSKFRNGIFHYHSPKSSIFIGFSLINVLNQPFWDTHMAMETSPSAAPGCSRGARRGGGAGAGVVGRIFRHFGDEYLWINRNQL